MEGRTYHILELSPSFFPCGLVALLLLLFQKLDQQSVCSVNLIVEECMMNITTNSAHRGLIIFVHCTGHKAYLLVSVILSLWGRSSALTLLWEQ